MEMILLDYLKEKSVDGYDNFMIHVRSSRLSEANKVEYKLQLINDILKPLVQQGKCRFFRIFNEDFFIFFKEAERDYINTALLKIKFHFADDENLVNDMHPFLMFYNVAKEYETIRDYIKSMFSGVEKSEDEGREFVFVEGAQDKASSERDEEKARIFKAEGLLKKPLSPKLLGLIEKNLENADFANMIRRQSVCAIFGKSFPQPLFDEVFVSISDLQSTLMPDINFTASPWLFKHLTEVLDRRVLSSIRRHEFGSLKTDFSININTASIISSDFGKFDEKLNPAVKSTVILELNPSDVFSDLHTFILARDFAKSKGYRICLDSVSFDLLEYIDRKKLGIDMMKTLWSPKFIHEVRDNKDQLLRLVHGFGQDRVIMRNVDDAIAVEIGQQVGVSMFQGTYISQLLSSDPRKRRVGTTLINR